MSKIKVPCHFGSDLDMIPKRALRDRDTYLELFAASAGKKRRGESTPFYLYSQRAAEEIKAFDPEARIIIMLRNPVDMMYSMHARNLMDGNEDIQDFAEALQAEEPRKRGQRLSAGSFFPQGLYYRELAKFSDQVRRYLQAFDKQQIHVVVFDDLKAAPQESFDKVLTFLGLDPGLPIPLKRANKSVAVRSPALAGLLREPPAALERLPGGIGRSLIWRLNRWNRRPAAAREKMDPALRRELLEDFAGEIRALGDLLQRDLSPWLNGKPS